MNLFVSNDDLEVALLFRSRNGLRAFERRFGEIKGRFDGEEPAPPWTLVALDLRFTKGTSLTHVISSSVCTEVALVRPTKNLSNASGA